jgi:hypothetical protein
MIFLPKVNSPAASQNQHFLSKLALLEILNVTREVKNIRIKFMGQNFSYEDICARWKGKCFESGGEKLLHRVDDIFNDKDMERPDGLTWPIYLWYAGHHFEEITLPEAIGSPVLDSEDFVTDVKAFRVSFFLRSDTSLITRA